MGTDISTPVTSHTQTAVMERESSYSATTSITTDISLRICSLDEEVNRDKANDTREESTDRTHHLLPPPLPINELNECNNMMDEDGNITVNSFCYCDSDSVYVVILETKHNGYKVIDLFEQRERMSYCNRLTLIDDVDHLKAAKQQYKQYLVDSMDVELAA
eukprot:134639_1